MTTGLIPTPQSVLLFDDTQFLREERMASYALHGHGGDTRLERAARVIAGIVSSVSDSRFYALLPAGEVPDAAVAHPDAKRYDSYSLEVSSSGIRLYAGTPRGLFYGLKTLEKLRLLHHGRLPFCKLLDWADTAVRCDYLEFRNFHPLFENVLNYVRQMASMHINELIVEWEDKRLFPMLPFLRNAEHAFTRQEMEALCQTAHENFINLVPLQQSFGHLEYVLRHPRYYDLREMPDYPADLSPLNPASVELSKALLTDVIEEFPRSEYIHIGCDEVRTLGKGKLSKASGQTDSELFIGFINQCIDAVCTLGKTPLVWHDMVVGASPKELEKLDKRVIVVVWMYDGNDLEYRAGAMLEKLRNAGIKAWGGCSVRCWDRSGRQNYPLLANRKNNILRWRNVAARYALEGMINTNWSAYSALAAPYGVYETSRYPSCFAAAVLWNREEADGTYLERYLRLCHGVETPEILREGWQFEDYFEILPRLLPSLIRERELAELIACMQQYEHATVSDFSAELQMFRVVLHPEKREEWESLAERHQHTFGILKRLKEPLTAALSAFLTQEQTQAYVCSRYYVWETVEKELCRLAEESGVHSFPPLLTES